MNTIRAEMINEDAATALQGADFNSVRPNVFGILQQFLESVKPASGKEYDKKGFAAIVGRLMVIDNARELCGKNYLGYQRVQIAELTRLVLSKDGKKPLGGQLSQYTYDEMMYYLEVCRRAYVCRYVPKEII